MKGSRVVTRDELGESTLGILREFDEWFLPATMEEVGHEFIMFLKWIENNGYVIRKEEK
ncbi:hypothetical protein LCGC14_2060590 [marine sediment metagenome]|uniref:Uncharacterized protein n=1 Tax=marine sediment metagenome TaxID=412755 RepID=A0A0F9GZU0_9ZZZZ